MSLRSGSPRSRPSSFREIWVIVARIPRGRVATYGQIARMAGMGRGARIVGWAMRALPDDLRIAGALVPWHRVVNAAGRISPRAWTGGACPEGPGEQAARLRREGIPVSPDGGLDLARHLWEGSPRRARGDRPSGGRRRGAPARA